MHWLNLKKKNSLVVPHIQERGFMFFAQRKVKTKYRTQLTECMEPLITHPKLQTSKLRATIIISNLNFSFLRTHLDSFHTKKKHNHVLEITIAK